MARIVNRAGEHGTGNLKKDEAGTWIDVGLRGPFKCYKQRCNLESAEQKKPGTQNAGGVTRSLHEAPRGAVHLHCLTFDFRQKLQALVHYFVISRS